MSETPGQKNLDNKGLETRLITPEEDARLQELRRQTFERKKRERQDLIKQEEKQRNEPSEQPPNTDSAYEQSSNSPKTNGSTEKQNENISQIEGLINRTLNKEVITQETINMTAEILAGTVKSRQANPEDIKALFKRTIETLKSGGDYTKINPLLRLAASFDGKIND